MFPSEDSSPESSTESVIIFGTSQSADVTQALPTVWNSSSDMTSLLGKYVIRNLRPVTHLSKTCILKII